MRKHNFDEVTKEELLDSIRELSNALEYALNEAHCDVLCYRTCDRALIEHSYGAYRATYDLPE